MDPSWPYSRSSPFLSAIWANINIGQPERPFTVKELTAKSRQFGEGGRKVPEFLPLSCQGGRENLPGTIGVKYKLIEWMQKSLLNL